MKSFISETIAFILSNFTLSFLLLGIIVSLFQRSRSHEPTRGLMAELLLRNYLLYAIGICLIYNFVMHVFFAETAAQFIGWENSPFQYEVGYASLGFGVAAILAYRGPFRARLVAIMGPALFFWGAAGGHIYQIIKEGNFAPGNAGIMLWTDIFFPIFGLFLLYLSREWARNPLEKS